MKTILPLAVALALAPVQLVWSQSPAQTPAQAAPAPPPCLPSGNTRYVCNVQVVEDMMVVPGGRWVIGSAMTAGAGGLYLIDTRTLTAHTPKIVMGKAQAPYDRYPGPPNRGLTSRRPAARQSRTARKSL